jgi:hypothetical protein
VVGISEKIQVSTSPYFMDMTAVERVWVVSPHFLHQAPWLDVLAHCQVARAEVTACNTMQHLGVQQAEVLLS